MSYSDKIKSDRINNNNDFSGSKASNTKPSVSLLQKLAKKDNIVQQTPSIDNVANNNLTQLKSSITYKTQDISYTDSIGNQNKEVVGGESYAHLEPNDELVGSGPSSSAHDHLMKSIKHWQKRTYIKGHLMNDNLGGIGARYNLFPISYKANSEHKLTAESSAKEKIRIERNLFHKNGGDPSNYAVEYIVKANTSSPDISKKPLVNFECTLKSSNTPLEKYTITSDASGVGSADQPHNPKEWAKNNLGPWQSLGSGESDQSLKSRTQSTVNGHNLTKDQKKFDSSSFLEDSNNEVKLSNLKEALVDALYQDQDIPDKIKLLYETEITEANEDNEIKTKIGDATFSYLSEVAKSNGWLS